MNSNVLGILIGSACTLLGFLVSLTTERLKAKSARNNHISQARFDKEFVIYQELSEKNLSAVYDAGQTVKIIRGLYNNDLSKIDEHANNLRSSINDADFSNKKYAPFISKDIYENYKVLIKKINEIYSFFSFWHFNFNKGNKGIFKHGGESYTYDQVKNKIEELQKEVSSLSDEILDQVRNYLQKLDAIS